MSGLLKSRQTDLHEEVHRPRSAHGREAKMRFDPFYVVLACFSVSSLAGLASLLRSGKPLTWYAIFSAVLNGGLLGVAICLLWYNYFENNVFFLVGLCVLAGLGGMSLLDFILVIFARGGLSIILNSAAEKKDVDDKK